MQNIVAGRAPAILAHTEKKQESGSRQVRRSLVAAAGPVRLTFGKSAPRCSSPQTEELSFIYGQSSAMNGS